LTEDWKAESDPLVALGEGDPKPFEAFVIDETPTFLAFFRRLGAQPTEAEDLTQDLAFKLYRQAETYRAEGRFRAFAFRVARNLWIDRVRKVGREPRRTQGPVGDDMPSLLYSLADERQPEPGLALEQREEAERLILALGQLSEGQRLVFELGVMQELPYQEISEILEVPVGTVKSRMFHAVRNLRTALEDGPNQTSASADKDGLQ
jgi:RNA polymerase sigma-70 factor (ECF subfamily)